MARATMDDFNKRDIKKIVDGYADDATFTSPESMPLGGALHGRAAIEDYLTKFFDHYPRIVFTVKDVYVSNIFAMGASNSLAIEYDLEYTNREGKTFHNSGVSVGTAKGGKIVSSREYVFDQGVSREAWGSE
jgi:ketosteroid isomerase-like protein